MSAISLKNAGTQLAERLHGMKAGDELLIIEDGRTIAKVVSMAQEGVVTNTPRKLGFLSGSVLKMDPDFDLPMPDMQEYMH